MSEEPKLSDLDLAARTQKEAPGDASKTVETPPPAPALFGGKTQEQILAEISEKDRRLKELEETASRSKHEADFLNSQLEQYRRGPEAGGKLTPQQPTVQLPSDEDFVLRPKEANEKMIRFYLDQDRIERDKSVRDEKDRQARTAFEFGKSRALRERPQLYQGIENEVAAAVVGAYQGGQADVAQLDKPEFWENTAAVIRFLKGERNLDKYYNPVPNPVSPMSTERPTAAIPPQETISITDKERQMAKDWNVTEERLVELKKQDLERRRLAGER